MGFLGDSATDAPIGSMISYLYSLKTKIPKGWVVCDGRILRNNRSPFNGQTLPNMLTIAFSEDLPRTEETLRRTLTKIERTHRQKIKDATVRWEKKFIAKFSSPVVRHKRLTQYVKRLTRKDGYSLPVYAGVYVMRVY